MLFLLTSCDAFLNQEPLDQLAHDEYMTTETNVASNANDKYQMLPTHGTYGYGTFESDQHTDNMAAMQPSTLYAPGYWRVGQSDGTWYFGNIYRCNNFLENVLPA